MNEFDEFTESEYRRLLRASRARWRFVTYREALGGARGCLWRHDVDFSPHRALRLATIEAEESVRSTYFVLLHSAFYNALEPSVAAKLRQIRELGHDLGIHIDPEAYGGRIRDEASLDDALRLERSLIERFFGAPVDAFSFHNPTVYPEAFSESDEVAGLVNAYGRSIQANFSYVSDSNGYWRHRSLAEFIEQSESPGAHVLTHPEWWTPDPMSPRDRVSRCIDGRANAQHTEYDAFLARHGRLNVR